MIRLGVGQANERVRQVVVDDLIGADPQIEITGQARTGEEALALVREREPDVLVIDLAMPELSALELLTRIGGEDRSTRVIVCSAYYSDTYVLEAFLRGARGYVLKALADDRLVGAIRNVAGGGRAFHSDLIDRPLDEYLPLAREKHGRIYESLTDREREVLFLVTQGLSRTALADRLSISKRTIDKHLEHLFEKLGFERRAELMAFGFKQGFVPLPYVAPD